MPFCYACAESQARENEISQARNLYEQQQAEIRRYEEQICRDIERLKVAYGLKTWPDTVKKPTSKMINGYTREQHKDVWEGQYFDDDGYCNDHSEFHCEACTRVGLREMSNSNLPAIIVEPTAYRDIDKMEAKRSFENNVDFVQKALKLTDTQTDSIKVKDLGKKVEEAQQKITVGQMKSLMTDRIKAKGFIESIWFGFCRFLGI